MRISKVKIWLQVKKEVVEPLIKSKEILLNSPSKEQLRRAIAMMESVASNLEQMMAYVEYRMELEKAEVQKIVRYTKENHVEHSKQLIDLKISQEESSSIGMRYETHLEYFNYIIEQGAPVVELYHYYA
jgi:hypothetical protein